MLHLGIAAISVASGAAGYLLGKKITTDVIPKKLKELSKPRNFRKITQSSQSERTDEVTPLNDKEFASSGGFLNDIRKYDITKMNSPPIVEKRVDERDLVLKKIKKFDKSGLKQTVTEVHITEHDSLLNEIRYPNKLLKRLSQTIRNEKKESVEKRDNFLVQIELNPHLKKVNPLLIRIQSEIRRRQSVKFGFLNDIAKKKCSL